MDMMRDIYPSRLGTETGTQPRVDPVVYGTKEDGPLDEAQLEQFERDGYLWLPGFLSKDEVTTLKGSLEDAWERNRNSTADEVVREPDGDDIRSIFRVHETMPPFRRICADARFAKRAEQLLGSNVYVHHSRINYKPGFRGKEFYWHSDFETWHVEDGLPRMRTVSCVVTLSENTAYNGALMVVPGSHKTFIQCAGETPEENFRTSLRKQTVGVPDDATMSRMVDKYGIDMPTGPAGSVLFFDCNLLHGSNSNISPDPRANLFFVYNSTENLPSMPFGAKNRRPAFLASRDFTPVSRYDLREEENLERMH